MRKISNAIEPFASLKRLTFRRGDVNGFYTNHPMSEDLLHQDLMGRIANRDLVAFDDLYRLLAGKVYAFLRLRLTDESDLQDILQDTFLAVWSESSQFEQHSTVATWVFGIARHKLLDKWRIKKRREDREIPLLDKEQWFDEDFTPRVIERMSWISAVSSLTIQSKELAYLAFVERMAYQDIAQLLGIPEGTVKSRVYHLKSRLRTLL